MKVGNKSRNGQNIRRVWQLKTNLYSVFNVHGGYIVLMTDTEGKL